jgi:hypothetical protein
MLTHCLESIDLTDNCCKLIAIKLKALSDVLYISSECLLVGSCPTTECEPWKVIQSTAEEAGQ